MKHHFRRLAVPSTLAVCVLALVPAVASASSIVFTKDDGNAWLVKPDGSGQWQVTRDGSQSDPYEGPSQADDGTIVAARGSGRNRRLYRMKQNGTLLNQPIGLVGDAIEPRISPDGTLVAYWFLTPVSYTNCSYCLGVYDQTVYTYPDRLTGYEEIPGPHCCEQPSWMANQGIFLTNGSCTAWYHLRGEDEAKQWFNDFALGGDCRSFRDGEMSPGLDRIALVRGDNQETIQLYQANGSPPANPTSGCTFTGASGGEFIGPTWSPDGRSLAWEDADGIVIAKIPSVTDCNAINAANPGGMTLIPGGHTPDWGPADVNPGPRPQRGGGGGAAPEFSANIKTPSLGKALKRGVPITVKADTACGIGVLLRYRGKVVARGKGALNAPGKTVVKAKFTKRGKKKLRDKQKAKLKAVIGATDANDNFSKASGRFVLKR